MTTEFSAKTALITGAGRGIGRAAALGLADAGASVILLARSDTQLAETRALLLARGAAAGQIRTLRRGPDRLPQWRRHRSHLGCRRRPVRS